MAQKIQTLFIDDIDGGAAEGTVRFALDGTDYEIDLSGKHSDELRTALRKYVDHARKVGGPGGTANCASALTVSGCSLSPLSPGQIAKIAGRSRVSGAKWKAISHRREATPGLVERS